MTQTQSRAAAILVALSLGALLPLALGAAPGAGALSASANADRMRQIFEQLGKAEEELAQCQLVADFWEKEGSTQETLMGQYSTLGVSDDLTRTLLDRSRQLCYRCGFAAQDARLRVAQVGQRVAILRAAAAGQ
ncbi:hypothetical protein BH11PLA1_BH11PLA1_09270 [soil metagenome]